MTIDFRDVLEYRALKGILLTFVDSPWGTGEIEQIAPHPERDQIQRQFEVISECFEMMETGSDLRFYGLADCSSLFEKGSVVGSVLAPKEIIQILQLSLCVQSTKLALEGLPSNFGCLIELGRQLPRFQRLVATLSGKINDSGEVEDSASLVLRKIRREIAAIRSRLYESLGVISKKQNENQVLQDNVITIRNDRFVIPVRSEKRRELAGVVHGTSSSGSTIFVEPLETIELNNQLVRLRDQADEEIQHILSSLTEEIRTQLADLTRAASVLGRLDSFFARARFAKKYQCVIPDISETDTLTIVDGRHPVLQKTLSEQGKAIIPISVDLDSTLRVLVVSGPNMGGKTVVLKTVGLLTLMALSGIPVPAVSAEIGVFRQVFADIGDRQSIAENLSTFSSHLINIKNILGEVSPPALVLLDELGTGTDPAEGSALGVAIVENLRKKGVTVVVTTHHDGLKMYASRTPQVGNACVEFDEATLQPTFRLLHGFPGSSSGIEIARRLGLEEELLEHAQHLISEADRQIDLFSKQLREQTELAKGTRQQLETEQRTLEGRRLALEKKYQTLMERMQKEVEEYWRGAFEQFERETRALVSEIKDKYLAVKARREIERKTVKLRERAGEAVAMLMEASPRAPTSAIESREGLKLGSSVMVKRFGQRGTVIAPQKDGQWEVAVGNLKCVLKSSELELLPASPAEKGAPLRQPTRITVQLSSPELAGNEINLVGCTVEEALRQADKFLDQAYLASISSVRLIHGFGMGVLRRALSQWLAAQPYVEEFHPAAPNEGGNAVTVVSLKS